MPTLGDACGVIAKIFDFSQSMTVEIPSRHNFLFIIIGVSMLLIKDASDEFAQNQIRLFDSRYKLVRWSTFVSIMLMILLIGVFDAGQFIYANF